MDLDYRCSVARFFRDDVTKRDVNSITRSSMNLRVPVTDPYLAEIPHNILSEEEAIEILDAASSVRRKVFLYEALIDKHQHPFFVLRLACVLFFLNSPTMAMRLCVKAQQLAKSAGVIDPQLDAFIKKEAPAITAAVEESRLKAENDNYYQIWKPTKEHRFPFNLLVPPDGYIDLRNDWAKLRSSDDGLFDQYLLKLSIESHRFYATFLLTEKSTRDLICRGVDAGRIDCLTHSTLKDPDTIRSILRDALDAYHHLEEIVEDTKKLTRENLCRIHSFLMRNSRVSLNLDSYVSPGSTRTLTRKTLVISGVAKIQCCPYPAVDDELDYICKMGIQYINNWSNRNPFGVASWLHFAIARCLPFENGNGLLARLLASIPLIRERYPPVYIAMHQKTEFYLAVRKACDGDHSMFTKCLMDGINEACMSLSDIKCPI